MVNLYLKTIRDIPIPLSRQLVSACVRICLFWYI